MIYYMPIRKPPSEAEGLAAQQRAAERHAELMRKIGNYQPRFSQPGRSR